MGDLPRCDLVKFGAIARLHPGLAQGSAQASLSGLGLKELLRQSRVAAIDAALEASGQRISDASRLLGISDRALQMELAKRAS